MLFWRIYLLPLGSSLLQLLCLFGLISGDLFASQSFSLGHVYYFERGLLLSIFCFSLQICQHPSSLDISFFQATLLFFLRVLSQGFSLLSFTKESFLCGGWHIVLCLFLSNISRHIEDLIVSFPCQLLHRRLVFSSKVLPRFSVFASHSLISCFL